MASLWTPKGRPFISRPLPEEHCASHLGLTLGGLRTHPFQPDFAPDKRQCSGAQRPGCVYMSVTVFSTPLCGRSEYVCVCVCVCAQHTCTGVQYI